jgi:hypothetical protein
MTQSKIATIKQTPLSWFLNAFGSISIAPESIYGDGRSTISSFFNCKFVTRSIFDKRKNQNRNLTTPSTGKLRKTWTLQELPNIKPCTLHQETWLHPSAQIDAKNFKVVKEAKHKSGGWCLFTKTSQRSSKHQTLEQTLHNTPPS